MLATVILAAGKGKRMRSDLPKVLHPLLGKPLLEHVLEATQALDPYVRAVVVGHERSLVENTFQNQQGSPILWAVQEPQLGTGHAAHCGVETLVRHLESGSLDAMPGLDDVDVLIVNGDLPLLRAETLHGLLRTHRELRADASVLTCEKANPTGYGRIIRDPTGHVRAIIEEQDADPQTRKIREINVGTYVFRASVFREYYQAIRNDNAQGELYLTDVVVEAARGTDNVVTYPVEDETEIAQVNSRGELANAIDLLKRRLLDELMEQGVTILDPRTTYIEKGVRIGRDTRILPFTVIERDVNIGSGCEVGPFAHLRPGTRLADGASVGNFVEIKNSSVGRQTLIRHLSYIGDGIVGDHVNIGAGTIFANFDGHAKHKTVVEDGAFVGSGTILVAPVRVGKRAVTGAGSVILKNRNVGEGEIVVGAPAKTLAARGAGKDAGTGGSGPGEESQGNNNVEETRGT